MMVESEVVDLLLNSEDPSIRFKASTEILGEDDGSTKIRRLQQEVKSSPRVKLLLSERCRDGKIPYHPYAKWYGAHWVLATLADIGYPPGDKSLVPLKEQEYDWLLSDAHSQASLSPIRTKRDAPRFHASIEGNGLFAILKLGLVDKRAEILAERLVRMQWPDGGWNCDGDPKAHVSSFEESLIPLRALVLHAEMTGNSTSRSAVERAAGVFLSRHLYKRRRDGRLIRPQFVKLHYPCYWHYDILFGLKVMKEAGFIQDERCADALTILESKRLKNGGFPSEGKFYRVSKNRISGRSLVGWGPIETSRMNEFVTAEAYSVLGKA